MAIRKILLLIIVLFCSQMLFAQTVDIVEYRSINNFPFIQNADSVKIFFEMREDKETSLPNTIDNNSTNSDATYLITDTGAPNVFFSKSASLSGLEIERLNRMMADSRNYIEKRSLLDEDISILYYRNGEIIQRIHISSITRDITIFCENALFNSRIKKQLEDFITKLLIKKGIWDKGTTFMPF